MESIGFAFAGLRHSHAEMLAAEIIRHRATDLVGIWEEDEASYTRFVSCLPEEIRETICRYPDYPSLLSDARVAAVAVVDTFAARGKLILKALEAGKDCISDKPLCITLGELEKIEAAVCYTGRKVGCLLTLRHDATLRRAAEELSSGLIGQIHTVNFTAQHPLLPENRPDWYFIPGEHGGTINDIAPHGIDALGWMTGSSYSQTYFAREWNAFAHRAPHFQDCAQFIGGLASSAGVTADVSYAAPAGAGYLLPTYWRFSFFGNNGYLECRAGGGEILVAQSADISPRRLPVGTSDTGSCLEDFLLDRAGTPNLFDTTANLLTARRCLEAQACAAQIYTEDKIP